MVGMAWLGSRLSPMNFPTEPQASRGHVAELIRKKHWERRKLLLQPKHTSELRIVAGRYFGALVGV